MRTNPWAKKAIELRESGQTYNQIIDSIKAEGIEYKGLRGKDSLTGPNLSRFFSRIGMGKYKKKRSYTRRKKRTTYANGHAEAREAKKDSELNGKLGLIQTILEHRGLRRDEKESFIASLFKGIT